MAGRGRAERLTRRARHPARTTDREVLVVAAVLATGSEKAAANRLGLSHSTIKHHLANARSKCGAETTAQLVWILGPRLPEPKDRVQSGEQPPEASLGHGLSQLHALGDHEAHLNRRAEPARSRVIR